LHKPVHCLSKATATFLTFSLASCKILHKPVHLMSTEEASYRKPQNIGADCFAFMKVLVTRLFCFWSVVFFYFIPRLHDEAGSTIWLDVCSTFARYLLDRVNGVLA